MALALSDLLKRMLEMSGSDLHITTNSPPQIRVHGHLVPLDLPQMTPAETKQLAYSVMTDSQKHRFEENLELDFSFGLEGSGAFPCQRIQSTRRDLGGLPSDSLRDQVVQPVGTARGGEQNVRQAARSGPGHRPNWIGQIDYPGGHD